jgi:hypothetical protein
VAPRASLLRRLGTDSSQTHRWRELDSNFRFRARQASFQGFVASRLYQGKGQLVPGPDDNKGKDKSVVLLKPEKQTELRMRTKKTYNAAQKPMALPGDEGFSFRKA